MTTKHQLYFPSHPLQFHHHRELIDPNEFSLKRSRHENLENALSDFFWTSNQKKHSQNLTKKKKISHKKVSLRKTFLPKTSTFQGPNVASQKGVSWYQTIDFQPYIRFGQVEKTFQLIAFKVLMTISEYLSPAILASYNVDI